jgi:hypothetical protein
MMKVLFAIMPKVSQRLTQSGNLSPGIMWPERKTDHSLPSDAEVKNA